MKKKPGKEKEYIPSNFIYLKFWKRQCDLQQERVGQYLPGVRGLERGERKYCQGAYLGLSSCQQK